LCVQFGYEIVIATKEENIMRSVIYGAIIAVFLASAGTVQAGELDGRALLCNSSNDINYPVYGLVFEKGMVSKWQMEGYSKKVSYSASYEVRGIKKVRWWLTYKWYYLNRETLTIDRDQCAVSSKTKVFQKLDEIIATAKKKNKF
jgi:hypothetical protein